MTFSLTGFSYLILFVSLSFLTFRFFQYWKQKKDIASKIFLLFGLTFTLFALVRVVSVFFFVYNTQILLGSIVISTFLQSLAAAIVAYLIVYIKFPSVSPWLGFAVIAFLGLIATILACNVSYQPVLSPEGIFDWGFPSFSSLAVFYSILRLIIILATFLPLMVILLQDFVYYSEDKLAKKRVLGLFLILCFAMLLGVFDFILTNLLKLETAVYRDYISIIMGCFIFLVILLTQKPIKS